MTMTQDLKHLGSESDKAQENRLAAARWLETQRGKPQYRAAPHIRKSVARIMRPLSKKHGGGGTGLAQYWGEIVGPRFAKISKPVKFTGGKDHRSLVISAPGPAAALIMASSQTIIDRANSYLGMGYVQKIKIIQTRMRTEPTQGPTPRGLTSHAKDKLQSGLENIDDDALREALEALGHKVLAKDDQA